MVSEDELPTESSKEPLETEAVSDEELPDPTAAVDLPDTEAVSEDELPPEKTDKKKKKTTKQTDGSGKCVCMICSNSILLFMFNHTFVNHFHMIHSVQWNLSNWRITNVSENLHTLNSTS